MRASYVSVLTILFCSVIYSIPAYPQEDTTKYKTEEIMVTGTRTEEKIINIPYSVERIEHRTWLYSRNMGINDVLGTVPGLFMQSRYGNHDVRLSIRGYGSKSVAGISGVRILLDGIPESEPDGRTSIESLDFNSIANVEVVKGNASSLYTNAGGGAVNFLSDINFLNSFVTSFNEFGSFDMRNNGVKLGLTSGKSRLMLTYSYENYEGYREHSQEYMHRLNSAFVTEIGKHSILSLYGYYVNGLTKLPGSQTLEEYKANDTAANEDAVRADLKRLSKKGRLGVSFNTRWGKDENNIFEVNGYGTIKDLERTSAGGEETGYVIFDRFALGSSMRYINKTKIDKSRANEFSIGGDYYFQTGPVSEFDDINGQQGDILHAMDVEGLSNIGFYVLDKLNIIKDRLDLLATMRYDRVAYDFRNRTFHVEDTARTFSKLTPKIALNLKFTPSIAFFTSFGLGFDTPTDAEISANYPFSSDGGLHTLNPDLNPQKSKNFEAGIKGSIKGWRNEYFRNTFFEATFFYNRIEDEIIPFEVGNEIAYRNAASTNRIGAEFGFNSELIKGLNLKTAYTYSHFKYNEYKAYSYDEEGNATFRIFDGNWVPSIPKNLLSADLSYQYQFSKNYTAFVKGNYQFVDKMFVNDEDTLSTDSYSLLNGQAGLQMTFGKYNVSVYGGVGNITNKKYVSFINVNSSEGQFYEAGAPRNYFGGIQLGYTFK